MESIQPRPPRPCEVGRPKGRRRKNRRQSHTFFLAPAAPGTPTRRHALGRLPTPPPLPENLLSDCTENCPLRGGELGCQALNGVTHQPGCFMNFQLGHDSSAVRFSRLDADLEERSHLFGGLSLRDQLQNLSPSRAQGVGAKLRLPLVGRSWRNVGLTLPFPPGNTTGKARYSVSLPRIF